MEVLELDIESEFINLKDQLMSYLYRLAANTQDAEDIVQDTYIKVKEKFNTFKGNSSFKTWVFSIATNLARDNHRVKNRWKVDAQDDCKIAAMESKVYQERMVQAFNSQAEKRFEIEEHMNYCFTCLAKNLTLEQQITVVLKEIYGFKRKGISNILGKSESVVKHLLFNGRKSLQTKYEHRCAMINKKGACYQCAELNDNFDEKKDSVEKIAKLGISSSKPADENLDIRFQIINKINPLHGNGAKLEDTIMQILREAIND